MNFSSQVELEKVRAQLKALEEDRLRQAALTPTLTPTRQADPGLTLATLCVYNSGCDMAGQHDGYGGDDAAAAPGLDRAREKHLAEPGVVHWSLARSFAP